MLQLRVRARSVRLWNDPVLMAYYVLSSGYGLTETSPAVTITPYNDKELVPGSAGCVIPNTEVKVGMRGGGEITFSHYITYSDLYTI